MLLLLAMALALLLLLLAAAVAHESVHPPACTLGWALARRVPADPGDLGLPLRSWTLDRPDGAVLPVWDVPLPGADEPPAHDALCVVLVHGWGRSRIESLGRLRTFLAVGPGIVNRVVLPDLRGHGDAERSRTRLGWREEEDLLALIERLDGRVVLAGHSMGGVISIHAAARESPVRDRIAGVIAWGPYENVHVPIRSRLLLRGGPARPISDLALLLLRLVRGIRRPSTIESARRMRCPLLVIAGDLDRLSPISDARAIASAAPAGTILEVTGGAHPDMHLVDPPAHDATIAAWLEGLVDHPGRLSDAHAAAPND